MKYDEQHQRELRQLEIPKPIRDLGINNNLIHHLITQFIMGVIITKEEFYCQCIAGLANNWSKQNEDYVRLLMMTNKQ